MARFPSAEPSGWRRQPLAVVADDRDDVRRIIAAIVADRGFRVIHAENGREALPICADATLLVTDIEMPAGSGIELIEETRSRSQRLAIVAMSGSSHALAEAQAAGADALLQKPFPVAALEAAITDALGLRRS